ncbi:MAG TPA: PAS domain S-box protein [Ktedonobacterales bacterium]|nr:PAS domain S-box protein [Ktedonobacterales bacterium]
MEHESPDANGPAATTTSATTRPSRRAHGRAAAQQRAAEAEARLAAMQRRYLALAQAVGEWTWRANPDGTLGELMRNGTATARQPDTVAWEDMIHPDDRAATIAAWQRAVRARGLFENVQRLRGPDGEWHVMGARGVPVLDDAGAIVEWIGTLRDISERTRTREQLARQASMLERTHDAIFTWELGGAITYWNRGAELLYGYTAADAIGRVSHELLRTRHPLPIAEFEAQLARLGEWTGELTHTTRDGRQVVVESRQQVLREPDGRACVLETAHDITDRRQLERWLSEHAHELSALFEAIPDPIIVYDRQAHIIRSNGAAQELLARAMPPERQSLTLEERGAPTATRDEHGRPLALKDWPQNRILRGESLIGARAMEFIVRGLDGQDIQCAVHGVPLRDAAGAINGAVVVFHEVTERRRLERRTQDALNALLAMAHTLILPDDTTERADPDEPELRRATHEIAQRLAELTRQVLGCERVAIYSTLAPPPEFQPLAAAGLLPEEALIWRDEELSQQRFMVTGAYPAAIERVRAGESVTLDLSDWAGRPGAGGVAISDVLLTPMRVGAAVVGTFVVDYRGARHRFTQGEIALTEAVAQLAALVTDRARLLRERAAAQVEETTLREVNQRLDQFLSIASHELKTPLTTIKSNTQLLLRGLESGRAGAQWAPAQSTAREMARRRLDGTVQGVNRMVRLVDDLLDMSRIREGQLELHPVPCDLAAVVRTMVREQRQQHPQREIQLDLPARARVIVTADAARIGQVVTNFLTNALKYSDDDRSVRVSLREERRMARVLVHDEGPGLPAAEHELVWTLFHRAPGVQVRSGSGIGLGLGLHICKMIIDLHGGRHGVISKPGEGATFWFTLPLAPGAAGGIRHRGPAVPAHGR